MPNEPKPREVLLGECREAMNRLADHPKNTKYVTDVVKAATAVMRADQHRISVLETTLVLLAEKGLVSTLGISSAMQEATITVSTR